MSVSFYYIFFAVEFISKSIFFYFCTIFTNTLSAANIYNCSLLIKHCYNLFFCIAVKFTRFSIFYTC